MKRTILLNGLCGIMMGVAGAATLAQGAPELDGILGKLAWHNQPATYKVEGRTALTIVSGANTDLYVDAFDAGVVANVPILTFDPGGNFVLSAKVRVDFRSNWDAGALMLWADDHHWAKFAYEYSWDHKPTLVSVVTRGTSDDCNSVQLPGDTVYLQIARRDDAFIFWYSADGKDWRILRVFRLDAPGKVLAGFESQSPVGKGTTAVFSEVHYEAKRIPNPYTGK